MGTKAAAAIIIEIYGRIVIRLRSNGPAIKEKKIEKQLESDSQMQNRF